MARFIQHSLRIADQLGARLREARESSGISQKDLAQAGGVSRFTQAGYETEATEPNTGYLKAIQDTGIDLYYVLTGSRSDAIESTKAVEPNTPIDWERLRAAYDDVDFFCQRVAPTCPPKYRWQLVAKLYHGDIKLGTSDPKSVDDTSKETMTYLNKLWKRYA